MRSLVLVAAAVMLAPASASADLEGNERELEPGLGDPKIEVKYWHRCGRSISCRTKTMFNVIIIHGGRI